MNFLKTLENGKLYRQNIQKEISTPLINPQNLINSFF